MESLYDYRKYAVLYVDDEEMSLKYFTRAFQAQFQILTAANAKEAYQLLEQQRDKIALIMTDQRMPGEQGVQFLGRARQLHPAAIRILTTAYSDLEVAIEAVNSGAIYKYITKPWEVPDLEVTLKRALEFFMVQRERDLLLREKLSALHRMMITDRVLSLGIVAARLDRYVRNPMVAVRSLLDIVPDRLLQQNVDLDDVRNPNYWKEFYIHSQAHLRRVTSLLGERINAPDANRASRAEMLNIKEACVAIMNQLNGAVAQRKITLRDEIPGGLPPLVVERDKFERLLDLLLNHEIVSLAGGNEIILNARHRPGDEELLDLEVTLPGVGLPAEALRALFDPFARSDRHRDFGVNLMACYFLTHHHGGKIEIRSEEGERLLFRLTFPMQPKLSFGAGDEEAFLQRVLVNDAFWERVISGQE
jgi:two-component system probable response regulator PhcQ